MSNVMSATNRQILNIAVPSIITNITVPLLGLVDVAIVGHIGDAAYISAIAIGSMLFNIIYWVFGFLRMGTSGMTAQAYGQRNFSEMWQLLVQSMTVAMGVAFIFLLLQYPVREAGLWFMNTPEASRPLVRDYFNICIWGAPAMLGLYGLSGWYIGMQNTRIPMLVSILQNVVNILMSLLLVFGLEMKIKGVATGTLIAQWVGFGVALLFWYVNYRRHFRRTGLQENKDTRLQENKDTRLQVSSFPRSLVPSFPRFFSVNRDIFLRTIALVAVNTFFISAGAKQGSLILAVNTLLMTLFTLYSYFLDGFAYAGEAVGGRYWGSKQLQPFREVTRGLFLWGGGVMLLFTVIYAIGGAQFLHLLTNNEDVIRASAAYFPWALVIPLCGLAAFIFDGLFIGMTATRGMLISCVTATVVFFVVYVLLEPYWKNHALWLAFVLFLFTRGFVQYLLFRKATKKIS